MQLRTAAIALLSLLSSIAAAAAAPGEPVSSDGVWTRTDQASRVAPPAGERVLFPQTFTTFALAADRLKSALDSAPRELSAGAAARSPIITLPMPDGSFARFTIQDSPIMAPDLASSLPDLRTYIAQGVDDPGASGRLDFSSAGFHGLILSEAGAIYIDPYGRYDDAHYMSYWRRDFVRESGRQPFTCEVETRTRPNAESLRLTAETAARVTPFVASGSTLRTYRLALAATGEYTAFNGGSVAGAQAAMVTTMNRVNAVYEREIAVRLVMISNAAIVFTNAATDPYLNTDADLNANQSTIDARIGSANYDIGHLFGTGGGGVAKLGVVCSNPDKARGLTGSNSPTGDAFDIDYVAHELGHQFDADHTFNGTSGSCGGGNRAASSAYEPGSGSTVMAYAGICEADDLQPHSDAYFHGRSYDQIVAYTTDTTPGFGGSCAAQSLTANNAPSLSAGQSITIPARTPFSLSGSGSDPDGDSLTFGWEEFDLGTAAPPNTDNGSRPVFRSFPPVASSSRTFPRLIDILNGTTTFGESLPTTTRTMTFRLTARDNKAGGGGVNFAVRTVNVSATAGPFTVTAPNTAVSWTGGTQQTVTWNVASTNVAPVNCASVNILLSADGGATFPTTVVAATPNDGSQTVTVPSVATTFARIKVECASAPFFNISRPGFTILPGTAVPANVTATAIGAGTVRISWTGVATATQYQFFSRGTGGTFAPVTTFTLPAPLIGNTATLTFDLAQTTGTAFLYRMRASDGNSVSPDSNIDLAVTVPFTDDPLTTGTPVSALHLAQLRTALLAVRQLAVLAAPTLTDVAQPAVVIKSVHITELRTAIEAARNALLLPLVTWTTTAAPGTTVRASDFTELRNAMK